MAYKVYLLNLMVSVSFHIWWSVCLFALVANVPLTLVFCGIVPPLQWWSLCPPYIGGHCPLTLMVNAPLLWWSVSPYIGSQCPLTVLVSVSLHWCVLFWGVISRKYFVVHHRWH